MERITMDVEQIELHPDNMNREEDSSLNKSWKSLI